MLKCKTKEDFTELLKARKQWWESRGCEFNVTTINALGMVWIRDILIAEELSNDEKVERASSLISAIISFINSTMEESE